MGNDIARNVVQFQTPPAWNASRSLAGCSADLSPKEMPHAQLRPEHVGAENAVVVRADEVQALKVADRVADNLALVIGGLHRLALRWLRSHDNGTVSRSQEVFGAIL
jgi:hypothetical protein